MKNTIIFKPKSIGIKKGHTNINPMNAIYAQITNKYNKHSRITIRAINNAVIIQNPLFLQDNA